jgi:hypothetical protein
LKEKHMSQIAPGASKVRFIIRATGDVAPLASFLDAARVDPGMTVVDTIGPRGAPHTAVIEMDRATAHRLEQRFRETKQLTIEPDRPLSLFN